MFKNTDISLAYLAVAKLLILLNMWGLKNIHKMKFIGSSFLEQSLSIKFYCECIEQLAVTPFYMWKQRRNENNFIAAIFYILFTSSKKMSKNSNKNKISVLLRGTFWLLRYIRLLNEITRTVKDITVKND